MFDSTTIPILEQVINFTQARHGVLAGNVANIDTPGYRTADLSPEKFEERLRRAVEARHSNFHFRSLGQMSATDFSSLSEVGDDMKSILFHDNSDVSLEQQVTSISKNQATHNMALAIMTNQFRLLESAISGRVI